MYSLYQKVTRTALSPAIFIVMLMFSAQASAQSPYDQRATDANEVNIMVVNNGIVGLDVSDLTAAGFWPRSAANPGRYLFGSGVWFAAKVEREGELEKRAFITYDPNTGRSWAAPGDISDGPEVKEDPESIAKYRIYTSTDYGRDGKAVNGNAPAWPLWNPAGDQVGPQYGNLGTYIDDVNKRTFAEQNSPAVFISDQDILCRYKDTDPNIYPIPNSLVDPLNLQFEQAVYSWNDPARENFILVRYDITNVGEDVLQQCFFGHAGDFDIGDQLDQRDEAFNDRFSVFTDMADRPMVAMWSEGGPDVNQLGYGYFGIAMLQTPAVDEDGFVRDDVAPSEFESQLGLTNVRNWVIQNDPTGTDERYDFMSINLIDNDPGEGADRRMLFNTGEFNLRPGETVRFVMAFVFAPSVAEAPDGTAADVAKLAETVNTAAQTWTNLVVSAGNPTTPAPFSVRLSPNPVNSLLNIHAQAVPGVAVAKVNIVDQVGRVLLTQTVKIDPSAGLQHKIDVASLHAGSYFCRVQLGEFTQSQAFVLLR